MNCSKNSKSNSGKDIYLIFLIEGQKEVVRSGLARLRYKTAATSY